MLWDLNFSHSFSSRLWIWDVFFRMLLLLLMLLLFGFGSLGLGLEDLAFFLNFKMLGPGMWDYCLQVLDNFRGGSGSKH